MQAHDAPPEWRKPFEPSDTAFQSGSSAFQASFGIDANSSPLEIFRKFVTPQMIANICVESNRFVMQVQAAKPNAFSKWKEVEPSEMWRFIGINLAMGLVKKNSVKSYWSKNSTLSTPFFGKAMGRNR